MAVKKLKVRPLYRVSTKGQLDKDDIPMQRNACIEFAKQQPNWELDLENEYIEKGVSGYKVSVRDRDIIQDVMNDAKNGEFDILLVFMFDRIGRREYETPLVMKTLDKLGIQLWSVKEGQQKFEDHSDDLINFIRFWQSGGESKKTSMRVNESHKQMALAGQFRGGNCPYGYRLVKSGQFNKKGKELLKMVIDEEESKIVELIFKLVYEKGYGGNRIAKYLNEKGIPSSTGGKWNSSVINYMLRNPQYKGYYTYGKTKSDEDGLLTTQEREEWIMSEKRIDSLAIIDEDYWNKVQEIRSSRSPQNIKDKSVKTYHISKSPLLFVGRIKCGHCGSPLTTTYNTRPYKKKDGTLVKYRHAKYRCSGKAMSKTDCDGQTIYSQRRIEDTVLSELDEFLSKFKEEDMSDEITKIKNKSNQDKEKELHRMKKKLNEAKIELGKLEEEVTKSIMGKSHFKPDLLTSLIDKKQMEIKELEENVVKIEEDILQREKEQNKIKKLKKYVPIWKDEFEKMDFETKKMLLAQVIKNITVCRDSIDIEFDLHIGDFLDTILNNNEKEYMIGEGI